MYKKILIPIDVAVPDDTNAVLDKARAMAAAWPEAELHVATVVPTVGMAIVGSYFDGSFEDKSRAEAEARLAEVMDAAGLKAEQHVLFGTIYDEVIGLSRSIGADLILIGAHHPELRDYLLGSNAARIVRHSNTSVLVVRT